MILIRATALIGVGLMWPAAAPSLQRQHAARDRHQTPEHHLQEAGRALERAWRRADSAERRQLGPLRTDFAQLVIAYSRIPVDPKAADAGRSSSEPGGTAEPAAQERDHPPARESAGAGAVPPAASGSIPAPPTGAKPPLDWQMKYAGVAADLNALGSTAHEASLERRLDHFTTHLRMFYAAALGAPTR